MIETCFHNSSTDLKHLRPVTIDKLKIQLLIKCMLTLGRRATRHVVFLIITD